MLSSCRSQKWCLALSHRVSVEVLDPAGQVGRLPNLDADVAVDLEEARLTGVLRHLQQNRLCCVQVYRGHLAEGEGGEHGQVVRLVLPVPRYGVSLGIAWEKKFTLMSYLSLSIETNITQALLII